MHGYLLGTYKAIEDLCGDVHNDEIASPWTGDAIDAQRALEAACDALDGAIKHYRQSIAAQPTRHETHNFMSMQQLGVTPGRTA